MASSPTRVAIVSPQEVFARGFAAMLAEHPERTEVTDVGEAEVILYDTLGVHTSQGSDLTRLVRSDGPRIVAISLDLRPDLRARALALGAQSWVSMSVRTEQLVDAVVAAAEGRELPGRIDRLGTDVQLTPREVEVLSLIAQGCSNLEVADRLYLSINSVKTYIRSAYAKIGATSRSRAVAWCLQNGFAPPDRPPTGAAD